MGRVFEFTTNFRLECWGGLLQNGDPNSVPRVPTAYNNYHKTSLGYFYDLPAIVTGIKFSC